MAAPPPDLAIKVAETVLVPAAERLAQAFEAQADAWAAGCQDRDRLAAAYHGAADAWAATEHVRFGPLSKENRLERIAFWPDPRNAIGRGLEAFIKAPDETALAPDRMAKASVAVQGLPVIERLLFAGQEPDVSPAVIDARRCAIGRAVSASLQAIAAGVVADWTKPEIGELARVTRDAVAADRARADAGVLLTDLVTLFQVIEERKLPPLSANADKPANPKSAESWRSGRSRRNIAINLEAAAAMLKAFEPAAPKRAAEALERTEEARRALLASPMGPVGFDVTSLINNIRYIVSEQLPAAAGVPLGFNSLDGD
jgi:predicted lipoprotein